MFVLFSPQTPLRALRLCEIIFFFSRKGARAAKNFNVGFVVTPNTFASFAPLRDHICFFPLAEAQRPQGTSMFDLLLPQIPLRPLRLGEIIFIFFSRKGAKAAKNFNV